MKILITGGAGYIGSHTAVCLLEKGYELVVADSFINSRREVINRIEKISGKKISFYKMDIREEEALHRLFSEHVIEAVIHFAGLKAVGESTQKPLLYYQNNLDSTMRLLSVMEAHGVKRLVFSSSATVYSPGQKMPLTEDSDVGNCSNPYGWTKFMSEQILRDLAGADRDWSICLLRYFNPVGAHESGLLGEDPSGIPNNLMPFICQTAVGRRKELSVFGKDYATPDGTGVRDYIHVMDLAEGHAAALAYLQEHKGVSTFNLGTGKPYSVLELVESFKSVNAVDVPYVIAPRRAGDTDLCYADPAKSREELSWTAELSMERMCRDAYRFQYMNPNGYEN